MSAQATAKISLWSQRLLRSKLHLPFHTALAVVGSDGKLDLEASLNTIEQWPLCGRQLNNHREARAQKSDQLEFAGSVEEFTYQLLGGKACTHCAKKAGLLVQLVADEESGE